jgi:DNA-binding NarL/FixJ family response regulator
LNIASQIGQRDQEILGLLCQGLADAAVARRLGLGHRTVQRRVQHIMSVLQVTGRVALGAKAQALGLLSISEQMP